MTPDQETIDLIASLTAERDFWELQADVLQERLEDTEEALRAAKGQLAALRTDRRYEVG